MYKVSPHGESCELCGTAREAKLRAKGRRVEMLTDIRRDGYHKIAVFSEVESEPEFSYTVGLFHTHKHPELVVFGLSIDSERAILDTVYDLVAKGARFAPNDTSAAVLEDKLVVFLEFSRTEYGEYLGQAENFYRSDDFPVLMVTWPDREGVFPWEKGASDWLTQQQPALWAASPAV